MRGRKEWSREGGGGGRERVMGGRMEEEGRGEMDGEGRGEWSREGGERESG